MASSLSKRRVALAVIGERPGLALSVFVSDNLDLDMKSPRLTNRSPRRRHGGKSCQAFSFRPRSESTAMFRRGPFLFTGAVVTLMILCSIAYLRGRRTYVTITVRNDSREIIRSARVRAFSLIPRVADLGPIAPKQAVTMRFLASGYSGYSITPTFASGRSFTTEEREALGGYAMTERILDTESLLDWDSISTIYERAFRSRNGWWLFPVFADSAKLNHECPTKAEQNGCRQRPGWHLSCHRRFSLAVATA